MFKSIKRFYKKYWEEFTFFSYTSIFIIAWVLIFLFI